MNAIVEQMKSEIESLTKERDKFKAAYYSAEKCASDLSRGCVKLQTERDECRRQSDLQMNSAIKFCQERNAARIERDALAASRYAYATEFSLDEEGQPDVGSIHQNIRALKKAAKLALDALYTSSHYTSALPEYHLSDFEVNEAIAALRQAGVQ